MPDAHVRIPLSMMNRHGLIAGATGTGKTRTLQLLAEQLSARGVPVVLADLKGDLSGLAAGRDDQRPDHRAGDRDRRHLDADRVPGRVPGPGRVGHRHPDPGDDDRVRPDAAGQDPWAQRHPGILAAAGVPLRRPGRAAIARPEGSPRRHLLPGQRGGQGRSDVIGRAVQRDAPASSCATSSPCPTTAATSSSASPNGTPATCCAPPRTGAASSPASSCPPSRTSHNCSRRS